MVEESFLPTVRTLMNAPATSPLAEVDINNVVELLVELTRPSALITPPANTEVRAQSPTQDPLCLHRRTLKSKVGALPRARL